MHFYNRSQSAAWIRISTCEQLRAPVSCYHNPHTCIGLMMYHTAMLTSVIA